MERLLDIILPFFLLIVSLISLDVQRRLHTTKKELAQSKLDLQCKEQALAHVLATRRQLKRELTSLKLKTKPHNDKTPGQMTEDDAMRLARSGRYGKE